MVPNTGATPYHEILTSDPYHHIREKYLTTISLLLLSRAVFKVKEMSVLRKGLMDQVLVTSDSIAHPSMCMRAHGSRFFREVDRTSITKIEHDEVFTGIKVFKILGCHKKPIVIENHDYYPYPGCLFVSWIYFFLYRDNIPM